MAPLIPKRKTSRIHTLEERPVKKRRSSKPEAAAGAQYLNNSAKKGVVPRVELEGESSDEDGEEALRSKQAYGSLLGALKRSETRSRRIIQHEQHADEENGMFEGESLQGREVDLSNDGDELDVTRTAQEIEDDEPGPMLEDESDSDEEDLVDPFEAHFASPDDNELKHRLERVKAGAWSRSKATSVTDLGRQLTHTPGDADLDSRMGRRPTAKRLPLKQRLRERGTEAMRKAKSKGAQLCPMMFNYEDLLFGGRSPANAGSLRALASLHALNHVLKTRDKVIKNTARLARDPDATLEFRDQGFTRPKILILLETRQMCVRYIKAMTEIFAPEQQENLKRFEDAFDAPEDKFGEDKPIDFRELFEGNDDNEFRIGIKFTRKTIKLYSQFYASDIILASPLGLRRVLDAPDPKKRDSDFLSSIEVFIVDQADAMLMQNFSHVEAVFEALNGQPKEAHGCDFSRVRQWYLDGHAKYLRQTVIFSAFITPELNGIFSKHMLNVSGKTKVTPEYSGAIQNLSLSPPVKQTFARFACRAPDKDPDERFAYFTNTIIPSLNRQQQLQLPQQSAPDNDTEPQQQRPGLGALIFIPSYLDFVRIRNYFSTSASTTNLTFGSISEYTSHSDTLRARSYFVTGRMSVLLYTGRAHHFHRYRLRGVKRVVFYGVPENPAFWVEVLGMLSRTIDERSVGAEEQGVGARCLFSRFDGLALERVVGSRRVGRMVKEGLEDVFEFL